MRSFPIIKTFKKDSSLVYRDRLDRSENIYLSLSFVFGGESEFVNTVKVDLNLNINLNLALKQFSALEIHP